MWPLEQMLSPIRDNIITQNPNNNEIVLMERIKKQKTDVLNQRISPAQVDLVRPEIVASWIRSYNYGLDPFTYNHCHIIDEYAFEELLREKDFFIKAADPYIHQLQTMDSNYLIFLTDEKGIILRVVTGNQKVLEQVKERFQLSPGAVWTEESVGTCSHVLSLLTGRPIQLCGPELYLETCSYVLGLLLGSADQFNTPEINALSLNQTACSSAPIFDAYGNLAGSLTIISPYLHHQNAHSLGLTVSTAWAIQNQYQLSLNSELLSVTLEAADDAVITISSSGVITKANMIAQKLLSSLGQELSGKPIKNVFGNQTLIKSVLETGRPIFNTEMKIEGLNQSLHLRSAQPVKDPYGIIFGCVLSFKQSRLSKLTGPISGLETRFTFDNMVGNSDVMIKSINMAQKVARLDANILIQGESGTGKEVLAQAIHNESRTNQPFIAVNCAAIPKSLIESELFGYEGGAFTGAERQGRPGKIELANGGTLFLDEIGDMPLDLQPVLLRVLEEKTVMRVGGSRYIPVNFRLITVSNKKLVDLVENKQFREDLYYRLAVFTIHIPPLRERASDVVSLAKFFVKTIAEDQNVSVPILSDAAIYRLLQYSWPGNVRQLKNAMLCAVTMASDGIIRAEDLPEVISGSTVTPNHVIAGYSEPISGNSKSGQELSLKEVEKITIMQALLQTGHNISEAASRLGMSRSTLYRKIKGYGLLDEMRTGV